jgi:acyl CoA:acetate/3-ketoacid CoA transferase beta subunit
LRTVETGFTAGFFTVVPGVLVKGGGAAPGLLANRGIVVLAYLVKGGGTAVVVPAKEIDSLIEARVRGILLEERQSG